MDNFRSMLKQLIAEAHDLDTTDSLDDAIKKFVENADALDKAVLKALKKAAVEITKKIAKEKTFSFKELEFGNESATIVVDIVESMTSACDIKNQQIKDILSEMLTKVFDFYIKDALFIIDYQNDGELGVVGCKVITTLQTENLEEAIIEITDLSKFLKSFAKFIYFWLCESVRRFFGCLLDFECSGLVTNDFYHDEFEREFFPWENTHFIVNME